MSEREQGEALSREITEFIEEHMDQLTRAERFSLGLGARKLLMQPGEIRTRSEIGRDAGVSRQAIEHIELRALRKCRAISLQKLAEEHLEWKPRTCGMEVTA